MIIVGSRFSSQAQDAWNLKPVSPIQWICKEWAKELGFNVWTTTITVFLMGWVYQRELVIGMIRGTFSGASGVLRRSPLSVSLYSLFIVIFFLLNGVPRISTCPISPSLQLLGVVVRTEKYGRVRHKALNAIMTTFPLDTSVFSVVFFCFSAFPVLWNDMECRYRWYVASFTLGYIHAKEDSPMAEEGFFLGLGPWPNVDINMGILVFYPPQYINIYIYIYFFFSNKLWTFSPYENLLKSHNLEHVKFSFEV